MNEQNINMSREELEKIWCKNNANVPRMKAEHPATPEKEMLFPASVNHAWIPKVVKLSELQKQSYELVIDDGYEFKDENGNVIEAKKIVLEKKKPKYPQSYEECCKVLNYCCNLFSVKTTHREELIRKFQFLLLYRDAYWKIAGDWKPDYDSGVDKFGIVCYDGVVLRTNAVQHWERHKNKVLDFPTAEMRDAFYENFKDLIEECKELL